MYRIEIGENRYLGDDQPCFIVAELGVNHNGDLRLAKKMVDAAKEVGVDAVKFQTFTAEEFIPTPSETYTYCSQGKEITESMMAMFKKYEFSEKEWIEIFNYCKTRNIIYFSTPKIHLTLIFYLRSLICRLSK